MGKIKKLKVTFIHPDLGIGGAERLVLDVALALNEQGVEVSFVTNHFDPNHAFEELKSGLFPVTVYGDWIPRSVCGLFQALCAYIRMFYLSLVYTIFLQPNDSADVYFVDQIPVAAYILKKVHQKVVYYCHHPDLLASEPGGSLKKLYRYPLDWFEEKGTNAADIILVNSQYTRNIFKKTFPSIKKRIRILYPSIAPSYVDLVKKAPATLKPQEVIPELKHVIDPCVFLSVNRYHPAKNLALAIQAMHSLKFKVPDQWRNVFLVIAGGCDPNSSINNKYFSHLKEYVESKNLMDKIFFVKSPSDQEKTNLLLVSNCLIYTPVKEHFGIVPLEAMTAGVPVIACDSGGPRETVEHGKNGYLCKPNPMDMANCMKEIVANRRGAKEMGAYGKRSCREKFSFDTFSQEIMKVVEELVSDKKRDIRNGDKEL